MIVFIYLFIFPVEYKNILQKLIGQYLNSKKGYFWDPDRCGHTCMKKLKCWPVFGHFEMLRIFWQGKNKLFCFVSVSKFLNSYLIIKKVFSYPAYFYLFILVLFYVVFNFVFFFFYLVILVIFFLFYFFFIFFLWSTKFFFKDLDRYGHFCGKKYYVQEHSSVFCHFEIICICQ